MTAWDRNPFNPKNNINYSEAASGLSQIFRSNGYSIINPFFNTTLPLVYPFDFEIDLVVLGYQKKFVDKLLSISLNFDHVLYVIDNETNADPKWSLYWSQGYCNVIYQKHKTKYQAGTVSVKMAECKNI